MHAAHAPRLAALLLLLATTSLTGCSRDAPPSWLRGTWVLQDSLIAYKKDLPHTDPHMAKFLIVTFDKSRAYIIPCHKGERGRLRCRRYLRRLFQTRRAITPRRVRYQLTARPDGARVRLTVRESKRKTYDMLAWRDAQGQPWLQVGRYKSRLLTQKETRKQLKLLDGK